MHDGSGSDDDDDDDIDSNVDETEGMSTFARLSAQARRTAAAQW
jgi:hypothetical protein